MVTWYRFTFAVYNKVNVTDDKQNKIQTIIYKNRMFVLVFVDRLKRCRVFSLLKRDLTNDVVFDLENAIAF